MVRQQCSADDWLTRAETPRNPARLISMVTKLSTQGHMLMTWTHAQGSSVQVYREVGTNGQDDKGAILAHRDLPAAATANDIFRAISEVLAVTAA